MYLGELANNNLVYNNYFSNENNVLLDGNGISNSWNIEKEPGINIVGGSYLGGDYWETSGMPSVSGGILDRDGISSSSYRIDPENIDHLPLVKEGHSFGKLFILTIFIMAVLFAGLIMYKKSH